MTISFATLAIPPFWENETTLLVASLRTYGGPYANQPIVVFTLRNQPLPPITEEKLRGMGAEIVEFEMAEKAKDFPLAVVPFGAAAAEAAAAAEKAVNTQLLAWLLPDTIFLNPPLSFEMANTKKLGYRPVHHQNIGSPLSQSPDAFWQQIYTHCQVPDSRIFMMETCFREGIRPYFNAGMLITRPEERLMHAWLDAFQSTYQHPDFKPFYGDWKYAIFMHQAVLSGVILNRYEQEDLLKLPEMYNYPLHMHKDYPKVRRIRRLGDLKTARYENIKVLHKILNYFDFEDEQKNWLENMITQYEGSYT